ncbi:STAS domain-containing protein [Longispora albida]|uniref:STAS domain-containing protein n=1 Tax=Longispora albida TaxID=203523 RepID=UPI0003703E69|nr:STAS domain-containing protein [Longispora albida]
MLFRQLRIRIVRMSGATILVASGKLDHTTAAKLVTELDAVAAPLVGRLILDLGEVYDTDLAGLGAIAHAARVARAHDRTVHLVRLQPHVLRRLRTAGLEEAFCVHEHFTDALAGHETGEPSQPLGGSVLPSIEPPGPANRASGHEPGDEGHAAVTQL